MIVQTTALAGLFEITNTTHCDERGRFTRLFCENDFATVRPGLHFTQINFSETHKLGTVRGLHYQLPPAAEAKLIRCIRGRVLDVAVDLRTGSPTFLRWHVVELAEDNARAVFIPEGFAHGFQALSDYAHLLYMHTNSWNPAYEAGLLHDDPRLAIPWPLPVRHLSARDRAYAPIDASFEGIHL